MFKNPRKIDRCHDQYEPESRPIGGGDEWRQVGITLMLLGILMYKLPMMMSWLHIALGGLYGWLRFGIGMLNAAALGGTPLL